MKITEIKLNTRVNLQNDIWEIISLNRVSFYTFLIEFQNVQTNAIYGKFYKIYDFDQDINF